MPLCSRSTRAVAASLRKYGQVAFNSASDRDSYERLIRKAVEIAPGDPANLIALANFLQTTGSPTQADGELKAAITALAGKTDSASQRLLGDAYALRATVALTRNGGVDLSSSETAASYLEQAITAYRASKRADLEAGALVRRGRLLRGIRTPAALQAAAQSFRDALKLTPETARADAIAPLADGSSYKLLHWDEAATLVTLDGSGESRRMEDAMPIVWDRRARRLMILRGGRTFWLDLERGDTSLAPDLGKGIFQVANGALLARVNEQFTFTSKHGKTTPIAFGTATGCKTTSPLPPGPAPALVRLSEDGETLATFCSGTVRYYDTAMGTPAQLFQKDVEQPMFIVMGAPIPELHELITIVAGPRTCGVFVDKMGSVSQLIKPNGTLVNLDVPPLAHGEYDRLARLAAFTTDGYLIVTRTTGPYYVFSCQDGARKFVIDRPKAPLKASQSLVLDKKLQWLDDRTLADVDLDNRRVVIIDWPSRKLTAAPLPQWSGFELARVSATMMAPAAGSTSPRVVRSTPVLRSISLSGAFPSIFYGMEGDHVVLPGAIDRTFERLQGERYMLVLGRGGHSDGSGSVVDLLSSDASPPAEEYWNVVARPVPGGWASLNREDAPTAVNVHVGLDAPQSIPLPAVTDALRGAALAEIAGIQGQLLSHWNRVELMQPNPEFLAIDGTLQLTNHPEQITARYRSASTLRSLTGVTGAPEQLLCASPAARGPSGDLLRIRPVSSAQALRVSYPQSEPAFSWGPVMEGCDDTYLLPGRVPAMLRSGRTDNTVALQWLGTSGWRKLFEENDHPMAVAGWALSSDEGLVLTRPKAPRSSDVFALYRVTSAGPVPACDACLKLALTPAWEAYTATIAPISAETIRLQGPTAMVLLDVEGTRFAYPDKDDLVVRSLESDAELLRIAVGRPVVLTKSDLVVDRGSGLMQFYQLN